MILCGGAGARLWPASRAERPKPFLNLVGERSCLQETVLRAQPLGPLVVLGGGAHEALIRGQLRETSTAATVLLEPEGRDTAAAVAAAAAWAARSPDAVIAILPADHHVPDAAAFRSAIAVAVEPARRGRIVALGVRPTSNSTALGYIQPGEGESEGRVKRIAAFVEKPDAHRAQALVAGGALWNAGVFVARADVLLAELDRWAPEVASAARSAVEAAREDEGAVRLGPAFAEAPRASFDRSVMERTDLGAVLPVDFAWSDLGAWDAIRTASASDADGRVISGSAQAIDAHDVLVRVAPGMSAAVVGVSGVAVVVEADAVLVCGLDHAQSVRAPPAAASGRFLNLAEAAAWLGGWLRTAALPLWATVGVDPAAHGFREALTLDGRPHDPRRRARVQARQAFVFARAAAEGLPGPWAATAQAGFAWFEAHARRADGLYATSLDVEGAVIEAEPHLYEHAFLLLALSALGRSDDARALLGRMEMFRHPAGGFREADDHPFQANAHMHLLEAALACGEGDPDAAWAALGDEVAELALDRFMDPATGALREFFDADWRPVAAERNLIEPGHQLEWAWLLARREDERSRRAAERLYAAGRRGFDATRGVVVNALHEDLSVRDAAARLWPQTEHLKAALSLGTSEEALQAANGLARFLDTPVRGVWRERMDAHGGFLDQPAPATSLYHLYLAIRELAQAVGEPC